MVNEENKEIKKLITSDTNFINSLDEKTKYCYYLIDYPEETNDFIIEKIYGLQNEKSLKQNTNNLKSCRSFINKSFKVIISDNGKPAKFSLIDDKKKELINDYYEWKNKQKELFEKKEIMRLRLLEEQNKFESDIDLIKGFFETYCKNSLLSSLSSGKNYINILYNDIIMVPKIADMLLSNPIETINMFREVIKNMPIYNNIDVKNFEFRINGLSDNNFLSIGDIRVKNVNKLYFARGVIRQKSGIKALKTLIIYECPNCGSVIPVNQIGDKVVSPTRCSCGRKGSFRKLREELTDVQVLYVEQPIDEYVGTKNLPIKKHLIIKGGLSVPDADRKLGLNTMVEFVYYPSLIPITNKNGSESTKSEIVLDVNNINPVKDDVINFNFSEDDITSFNSASRSKDFFYNFYNSIYNTHHGDEVVKKACSLQLFAGILGDKGVCVISEESHILLSGDPSTGKTNNFLKRSLDVAPIGKFVQATSSSKSGILGSANQKDPITGTHLYDAGALAKAHQGIVSIDEFAELDPEEAKMMNEAMEEGTITINKANIDLVVPAKVSVLAGANPRFGRFSNFDNMKSELGIEESVLSRFNLVFIMLDMVDSKRDEGIASKLLYSDSSCNQFYCDDWIRKYIIYAKHNVIPVIPVNVRDYLKSFWVSLRKKQSSSSLKIAPRQLKSLMRYTVFHAKAHLRDVCTIVDANASIELVSHVMKQFNPATDYSFSSEDLAEEEFVTGRDLDSLFSDLRNRFKSNIVDVEVDVMSGCSDIKREALDNYLNDLVNKGEIFYPSSNKNKFLFNL